MKVKTILISVLLLTLTGCARTNPTTEAELASVSTDTNTTESHETAEAQVLDPPAMSQEEETGSEEIIFSYEDNPGISDHLEVLEKTLDPGYLLENSDSRYLTEEDIRGFSKDKLRFARNEIFARHGKVFEDKMLQSFFYTRAWYHEEEGKEIQLNEYESYNCDLIQKREEQLESGTAEAPEPEGWVFLERKDNKCRYHGMEIDLSQDLFRPGDFPDYLVKYEGEEFHIDSTLMLTVHTVAARTSKDGVMILITGEYALYAIYTFEFEITPEGIREIREFYTIPVMAMDDYVCFWWCEDEFYGVEYYEWSRIDDRSNPTVYMGAYDVGETTWTANMPQEVKMLDGSGMEKTEIIQPGEKIRLISRLSAKVRWNTIVYSDSFLRIKRLDTGETVWLDCRWNPDDVDSTLLYKRFEQDGGFDRHYYSRRACELYHEKFNELITGN